MARQHCGLNKKDYDWELHGYQLSRATLLGALKNQSKDDPCSRVARQQTLAHTRKQYFSNLKLRRS